MSSGLFLDKNDKNMLIVITILIFVLVSDTMINTVADFLSSQLISNFGIVLFVLFTLITGITQYFLLKYVKAKINYMYYKSSSTRLLYIVVSLIQYLLLALVFTVIIQILISRSYSTYIIIALTGVSYILNISLMSYFAYKFSSWYLSNKYSMIVLLYSISFSIIAVTSSVAVTLDLYHLSLKPTVVYPTTEVVFPSYEEGSSISILRSVYDYVDLFSFILVWGASVLLLREYMHKWLLRHWILVCIPLLYYITTLIDEAGLYVPTSDSEWLTYYLYTSLNSTAGGLLFGFAFLIVARHIHNEMFKGYMIISAFGFILLFISNQVTLVATSYPPFGAVTLSFFGLSSYLIVTGLYSSAISVSQDAAIRRSIRKSVMNKSKLLGSIGQAEMQNEVQKWVKNLGEIHERTKTPTSMSSEDVRLYVEEVVDEIRKKSAK
ncbi:MAG TPA: hypothetical protein VH415_02770 [Nitrososphaeraceae archaeon]